MHSRTDQPVPEKTLADRRFTLVKAFVILTWLLIAAALVIAGLRIGKSWRGNDSTNPGAIEVKAVPSVTLQDPEPRFNEYIYEDKHVFEVLVAGTDPKITEQSDPLTNRGTLTLAWTPTEAVAETAKKRYARQEFRRPAYKRTIILPEGVSSYQSAVQSNGVLIVTYARTQASEKTIVPRRDN